jgi:hypothetical protein
VTKLTDPQEVKAWLNSVGIGGYTIRSDGIVDTDNSVNMRWVIERSIPIQFGNVSGNFDCHNTEITLLRGLPQSVGGFFDCHNTRIISLHDIHKQIKHIGGHFYCNGYSTHLLGLLLIGGITKFHIDAGPIDKIFNKYVGTGDILSAQDELIDAGFIDQARL